MSDIGNEFRAQQAIQGSAAMIHEKQVQHLMGQYVAQLRHP